MIVKSITGKTIYKSEQRTMRATLEEGVAKNVNFAFADLRKAHLSGASLDGLLACGASFWGADLYGADIGLADLRKTDLRCTNLKDVCFAESDLSGADLRGAFFAQTLVEGAVLDRITVSCPSFWDQDLAAASLKGAVFCHLGEQNIPLQSGRWVIKGSGPRLVISGKTCLWEGGVYPLGNKIPALLEKNLTNLRENIDGLLGSLPSHNANRPIPKREQEKNGA